jgi:exopolysaccharide biosynthesis polyprenyl glycosylphosphotransferase
VTRSHASLPPAAGDPEDIPTVEGTVVPPPPADPAGGRAAALTADALAAAAQRTRQEQLAAAAELAAQAAASGLDEDTLLGAAGVRPMRQLRPVPQLARPPISPRTAPIPSRPVYDPFSARRRRAPEWLVSYTVSLVVGDLVAAGVGVALALLLPLPGGTPSTRVIEVVVGSWVLLLAGLGAYAERRLGTGPDEYRRVLVGGLAGIALLSFAAQLLPAAGLERLLLVAAPVATLGTLVTRNLNRRRMHAARRRGLMTKRVVVVGRDVAAADMVRRLRRDAAAGLRVVGACVPRPGDSLVLADEGVPVLGGLDDVLWCLDEVGADAVVVSSASETAGQYLRDLAWKLEGTNIEVLVGPGLIEVSSNRLQVRPTTSLPLIQVQEPEFRGTRRLVKSAVDRTVAAVLLVLAAPGMIGIAIAVRLSSTGPALYRHRRIGKRGRDFDVLKFRSMVTDADDRIAELLVFNEGNDVQFKMRQDPRITGIGAFLRRYSLDELPQLINVLKGDMSLVGPRPHVTREVEQYGPDMHRRLLVKPGITGLWQVSGRSDLSWEETVELDVRYVENWSLGLDITILWRTFRAVLGSNGAY